jgi:hypothetical protein
LVLGDWFSVIGSWFSDLDRQLGSVRFLCLEDAKTLVCTSRRHDVDAGVSRVLARPYRTRGIWLGVEPEVPLTLLAVNAFWMLSFALLGLYGPRYEQSRLTEVLSLIQTTAIGALVFFFVTYFDDAMSETRADARPNTVLD